MSLYRCAACGSPNVITDTQNEGFNYMKGAIGTVVLGAGGAVAGLNGKTKTVYKCPDCGLTLNEPMSMEIKMLIDMGVMSVDARNNLKLQGIKIDWSVLTSRYKNIEDNGTIAQSNSSETGVAITEAVDSVSSSEKNDDVSADEKEKMRRVFKVEYANYIKQNIEWRDKCKDVLKNRNTLVNDNIEKERAKLKDKATQKRDKVVEENTIICDSCSKELEVAEKKLASLGFFKFSEKKDTKALISQLYDKKIRATNTINDAEDDYAREIKSINSRLAEKKKTLEKEADKSFPMPPKPHKSNIINLYNKDGTKKRDKEVAQSAIGDLVIEEIEKMGCATFEQIKEFDALRVFDEYYARCVTILLKSEHAVKCSGDKYFIDYDGDPNWEVRLLSDEDHLVHDMYMKERTEEIEKRNAEREKAETEYKNRILDIMKGKGPISIADVREYSSDLDSYKTDRVIRDLAEKGVIVERKINSRTYYEYE